MRVLGSETSQLSEFVMQPTHTHTPHTHPPPTHTHTPTHTHRAELPAPRLRAISPFSYCTLLQQCAALGVSELWLRELPRHGPVQRGAFCHSFISLRYALVKLALVAFWISWTLLCCLPCAERDLGTLTRKGCDHPILSVVSGEVLLWMLLLAEKVLEGGGALHGMPHSFNQTTCLPCQRC